MTTRNRRPPATLLQDLRDQRQLVLDKYGAKLQKLDGRIARITRKNRDNLAVEQLANDYCLEELRNEELVEAKRQVALVRKAIKAKLRAIPQGH